MSTARGERRAAPAPGVVKVRLSGRGPGRNALAVVLASHPAVQVLSGPHGPGPNRRDPGEWAYLTVRVHIPPATAGGGAQPPRKSAGPRVLLLGDLRYDP